MQLGNTFVPLLCHDWPSLSKRLDKFSGASIIMVLLQFMRASPSWFRSPPSVPPPDITICEMKISKILILTFRSIWPPKDKEVLLCSGWLWWVSVWRQDSWQEEHRVPLTQVSLALELCRQMHGPVARPDMHQNWVLVPIIQGPQLSKYMASQTDFYKLSSTHATYCFSLTNVSRWITYQDIN